MSPGPGASPLGTRKSCLGTSHRSFPAAPSPCGEGTPGPPGFCGAVLRDPRGDSGMVSRPAGPSTPHAGPTRPRHFNFFPGTPEGLGSGSRSRPRATRSPRPRPGGPGSLPARGRPAFSRHPARGPALACPAPPTLGAPRLAPRAARPLPPPAGRGPRRAAQKSSGNGAGGGVLRKKAFFARPPAPSLPRHPRPLRHSH